MGVCGLRIYKMRCKLPRWQAQNCKIFAAANRRGGQIPSLQFQNELCLEHSMLDVERWTFSSLKRKGG
jgi:hypothetical protein